MLIRLAHTAKIDAIFQTESGVPPGFQAPEDDRAAEFDANLARKWGFLFGVCANRISTVHPYYPQVQDHIGATTILTRGGTDCTFRDERIRSPL